MANGSTDYVTELWARLGGDFTILSGDDSQTLPFLSVGADGAVSVVSNVVPEMVVKMIRMVYTRDFLAARGIHTRLYGLIKSLFLEGNPVGVKYAMKQRGFDSGEVRPPLAQVGPATATLIRNELAALGLPQE